MTKPNEILSAAMLVEIDKELAKYPADKRKSASLAAIRIVQDMGKGWVTDEELAAIAEYLGIPAIDIYEVATFYTMCKREPIGKHHIGVCTNVPCMLNGSKEIAEHLKKKLGIGFGETSADGKYSLEEVECLGACVNAPVCQIGKRYHECLTPEKIDEILGELK